MAFHEIAAVLCPFQSVNQSLGLEIQLDQVICGAKADCLLSQLEILQVGQKKECKFAALLLTGFDQLQAIHNRHSDVCYYNIWI